MVRKARFELARHLLATGSQPVMSTIPSFARGGERGIRTLGGFYPSTIFKTGAFNHSAIPPLIHGAERGIRTPVNDLQGHC